MPTPAELSQQRRQHDPRHPGQGLLPGSRLRPRLRQEQADLLRLFFDTEFPNTGPEFRFTWYLGRTPTPRHVGYTSLRRVEGWNTPNVPKRVCPGMRHKVNYAKDLITTLIPRSCLGIPNDYAGQATWPRSAGITQKHSSSMAQPTTSPGTTASRTSGQAENHPARSTSDMDREVTPRLTAACRTH